MITAIIVVGALELLGLYFLIRTFYAMHYIQEVKGQMVAAAYEHLTHDDDYDWRIEQFSQVSFWRMVFSFKRFKIKNYWKSEEFVK